MHGTPVHPCAAAATPIPCRPQVHVADISSKTCMFSLLGPQADAIMQQLQAGSVCDAPYGTHTLLSFQGGRRSMACLPLHICSFCKSAANPQMLPCCACLPAMQASQ